MSCEDAQVVVSCVDQPQIVTTCDNSTQVVLSPCEEDVQIVFSCERGPVGPQGPPGIPGDSAVTSVFGRTGDIVAVLGDYTASQITNVASGGLVSTNVQSAINEVQENAFIYALMF